MCPREPPTANCIGPKDGNHSSAGLFASGLPSGVLQERVGEPTRDDQEEPFEVTFDQDTEEQAERAVGEGDNGEPGEDGRQKNSNTPAV